MTLSVAKNVRVCPKSPVYGHNASWGIHELLDIKKKKNGENEKTLSAKVHTQWSFVDTVVLCVGCLCVLHEVGMYGCLCLKPSHNVCVRVGSFMVGE